MELIHIDRARGAGGEGKYTIGRQFADEAGHTQQRIAVRGERCQERLIFLDRDESEADQDVEDDDGRNDRIRQRVERIRRNI